jgi:hypothetical protein
MGTEQHDPADPSKWDFVGAWCPKENAPAPPPMPTTAQLREELIRLLPHVPVGWIGPHLSLVNVQEILWVPTAADRDLGTVTIVGRTVNLRVNVEQAAWDFGDGARDSTSNLGRTYSRATPCSTKQCPGYYGHTYTTRGPETIRLSLTWTGQYSLDGGASWTAVGGGAITGPASTASVDVKEARAVLVK